MRQVSDGQQQVLHLHVRRVAAEEHVSGGGSHVFLVDSSVLVVNPVDCAFHLQNNVFVGFLGDVEVRPQTLVGSGALPHRSGG